MDVTCERCGTEYEFDETLVSDRGTTVKCTNCGHLFKVYRPGAQPGSGGSRIWSIRKGTGETLTLGSLRDLQRLITNGELGESDEISRSGEGWKPLGAIAELQTFFSASRAGGAAARQRKDGTEPFPTGVGNAPPYRPAPSARPPSTEGRAFARTVEADPSAEAGSTIPDPPAPAQPIGAAGRSPSARPPGPQNGPEEERKRTLFGVGGGGQPTAPPGTARPPSERPPAPPSAAPPSAAPPSAAPPSAAPPSAAPPSAAPPSAARPPASARPSERPAGGRHIGPTRPGPAAGAAATNTSDESPRARQIASTREAPAIAAPSDRPPAPASRRPAPARASERPSTRPLYVDGDDEPARPGRGGRVWPWVVLVLLLAAGGGVALGWSRIAPALGLMEEEDPVADFIARGDVEMALDTEAGYGAAIREYTRATAIDERDIRTEAALARAHAFLAQLLAFRASDLEARAAADPALAGEAAALRREQTQNAGEARRYAEDAVRQDPNQVTSVIALADAFRLTGDPGGAQSKMDRARTLAAEPTPDLLYASALLEMSRAGDAVAAARDDAARTVAAAPRLWRARLLLARAHLAAGAVDEARSELAAVSAGVPGHAEAAHLVDAIERGLPPAQPVVAVVDGGGAADAGPPEVVAEVEPPTPQTGTEPALGDGEPGGVPRGRDYSWYIQQGDNAGERGDVGRAREMYERALEVRPGAPEAYTGMGFVALDTGSAAMAVTHFRRASQAGFADAFIGLGQAYQRMGSTAQAIAAYEGYLERAPGGRQANIARRQLEALREQGGDQPTAPGPGPEPPGPGPDTQPAPPTPPDSLPPPRGVDPATLPQSDPPAVGSE